jgi:hypothetical protein
MKWKVLAAAAAATVLSASATLAADAQPADGYPDVVYNVLFLKDGEYLSTPTVAAQYGREVRIEVPNLMRVEISAERPDAEARSLTVAKLAVFKDGSWQAPKVMSMRAELNMTPSFEYSVEGTPYRFVVMPRQIVPAAHR